jgi:hypothetical protein
MFDLTLALIVAATAMNGVLAGASLDQSIKQLPARNRTGGAAYSVYSRASDLGNGIAWYAALGVGSALLTIIAAIVMYFQRADSVTAIPLYTAAVLSVLHSLVTARAAPLLMSQRSYKPNAEAEDSLKALFNRFAHLQALRAFLQVLTFGLLLWTIVAW